LIRNMTRNSASGRGSSRTLTSRSEHAHLALRSIVCALFVVSLFAPAAMRAQEGSDTQVHITPRVPPPKDAQPSTQPADKNAQPPSSQDPNRTAQAKNPGQQLPNGAATLKTRIKSYKTDVDLVLVPVTITDEMNRIVTGLDRDNFQVFESDKPEQIQSFSSEDAPISLGVIFDESGSMSDKIQRSRDAVVEFFRTANPQDEFFMITFSDNPQLLTGFTSSVDEIQNKLVYTIPRGRTALLDAVYLGLDKMREARNQKKALLIISDGGDNRSRYTSSEIKSRVREADVEIYAICISDGQGRTPEEAGGPQLLQDIAEVTGGRSFTVLDTSELADISTKIGTELRNQYVLGYRPTNRTRDGKWRKIKVKLLPPKGLQTRLHAYWKTGYYAPSE
jgi:Ca-activated chloride channel family protein